MGREEPAVRRVSHRRGHARGRKRISRRCGAVRHRYPSAARHADRSGARASDGIVIMAHHIDNVRQDLKIATRVLLKDRGFLLATVATLALCLAANAAIFAIVNAVLFRPLPYPEPERLVTMFNSYPGAGAPRSANSVPDYFDRLKESEVFKELALYTWTSVTVGGQGTGDPERILGMTVTPSFFHI